MESLIAVGQATTRFNLILMAYHFGNTSDDWQALNQIGPICRRTVLYSISCTRGRCRHIFRFLTGPYNKPATSPAIVNGGTELIS